jgi:hypothetical protein
MHYAIDLFAGESSLNSRRQGWDLAAEAAGVVLAELLDQEKGKVSILRGLVQVRGLA